MTAEQLTSAERDILVLMCRGRTAKGVALDRDVSYSCVKNQLQALRRKLGFRTLFQLGAWAERHGIREQAS